MQAGAVPECLHTDWTLTRMPYCCGVLWCSVGQVDYAAPAWVKGAAAAACVCGGLSIAALLGFSLGDPTWSISSGIGALFAAAVFEVRAPTQLHS